jgi:hypothetical protein
MQNITVYIDDYSIFVMLNSSLRIGQLETKYRLGVHAQISEL